MAERHYREHDNNDPTDSATALALDLSQQQFTGRAGSAALQLASFKTWNYLGITAKCQVAASAKAVIYDSRITSDGIDNTGSDEQQEYADKEFRWWKLLSNPSPWQTGRQLRWENVQQLGIHGISLTWNVKNTMKYPKTVMRIPIPMSLVTAIPPGHRDGMPYGGIRVSSYQWISRHFATPAHQVERFDYMADREISISDITLTAFPHPWLRGDGYSPSSAGDPWIKLTDAAEQAHMDQYRRGPARKFLIGMPDEQMTTSQLDAYQRKVDQRMTDTETGVVVVKNTNGQEITIDPDSMQYTQTTDTYGPATMALHGTPKTAVGMSDGQTYGGNSATMRGFTSNAVQPVLDLMADEDTATMRKEEGAALTIAYEAKKFDDPELQLQEDAQELSAKSMTVSEWRRKKGRHPFNDERDDMMVGSAALDAWGAPEPPPQPGGPQPGGPQPGAPQPSGAAPLAQPPSPTLADNQLRNSIERVFAGSQTKAMSRVTAVSVASRPCVIAFDLDGTLAEPGPYDESRIEPVRPDMKELAEVLKTAGCGIVVYTCRDDDDLVSEWLDKNEVPWDAINHNPWASETGGGKMFYDVLIDDRVVSAKGTKDSVLQGVLSQLEDSQWTNNIRNASLSKGVSRDYGYLFAPIRGELAKAINDVQASIDTKHLGKNGLEKDLHITLLYGLVGEYPSDIRTVMRQVSRVPFEAHRRASLFPSHDVASDIALVIELDSEPLQSLHALCAKSFANIQTHPVYRPHITLAYVKAEFADLYSDLTIPKIASEVSEVVYSHPDHPDFRVPLR